MGGTVFFRYDRAALDREYDNRGKVAQYAEYVAPYPAESGRTRDTLPTRLDLRYGPAPGETLDLFLPAGGGPAPVHAWRRRRLAANVRDMAGHDHCSITTELADPGMPLTRAILRQMGLP